MNERVELGSIKNATFGIGGYQDAMLGFGVTLGGKAWGVGDFVGGWAKRPDSATYSEEEHAQSLLKGVERLREVLKEAKRDHVGQLAGTPIEATFDGNRLVSWRVLTEVIP